MSVETKCSECGEWYGIGTSHKFGEPCRMCRHKSGATPMVPGRKLRDALLCAGRYSDLAAHDADFEAQALTETRVTSGFEYPKPHRSLIRLIGSIAWRLLLVMIVVGVIVAALAGGRA